MLTADEKDYLSKIDPKKKVSIHPYSIESTLLGKNIVAKIKHKLPHLEVLFMGSAALRISGQKDIDIYVLSDSQDFSENLHALIELFGESIKHGEYHKKTFYEWKFIEDGYEVEIYLTEPPGRQIKVFQILLTDKQLREKYEELKSRFNGKSYKDYQEAKYKFYNEILSSN